MSVSLVAHTPVDVELERLREQHAYYEARIAELGTRRWLTPDEDRELRDLKKRKLAGKDRMQLLMAQR